MVWNSNLPIIRGQHPYPTQKNFPTRVVTSKWIYFTYLQGVNNM